MGFPKIYQKNLRTVPFDIEDTESLIFTKRILGQFLLTLKIQKV